MPTGTNAEDVRQQRRLAFRNQVRYAGQLLEDRTIDIHLNRRNWNVNRAVQDFWEAEEADPTAAVTRPAAVEQGRLQALHSLQLSLGGNANDALRSNTAVIAMLYNKMRWILADIAREVSARNGNYDDVIDELAPLRPPVDGDVTRDERLARLIDITGTNSHHSAREFLEAHGYDLAMALDAWFRSGGLPMQFPELPLRANAERESGLRDVNFNRPVRAVRGGLHHFDLEQDIFNDQLTADIIVFDRPAREVNTDEDIPWARVEPLERELRTPARTAPGLDPEPVPGRDYLSTTRDRGARGYPTAAIINRHRSPPTLHCPDPTMLYVEYIRKGKYHCKWFSGGINGMAFGWDEGATALGPEVAEFDWHNKAHIKKLKKWRYNLRMELTGERVREEIGANLNIYENDWLREQEAIRHEERFTAEMDEANAFARAFDRNRAVAKVRAKYYNFKSFPLHMSKAEAEELTRRFNLEFAGRSSYNRSIMRFPPLPLGVHGAVTATEQHIMIDMSKVGTVPRPSRTLFMIKQHRFRFVSTAKHFLTSFNNKELLKQCGWDIENVPEEADPDFADERDSDDDASGSPESVSEDNAPANNFGGYILSTELDDNGLLPLDVFRRIVLAEVQRITDPDHMDNAAWGRVLGVMTEYYRTVPANMRPGRDEQRLAGRLFNAAGVGGDINLGSEPMDLVLSAITALRGPASAVPI